MMPWLSWVCRVRWDGPWTAPRSLAAAQAALGHALRQSVADGVNRAFVSGGVLQPGRSEIRLHHGERIMTAAEIRAERDALAAPLDVPAPWNASHPEPWDHVTLPRSIHPTGRP